jgi:hypothetical protein
MTSVKTLPEFISAVNLYPMKTNTELEIRFKKFGMRHFKILLSKLKNITYSQTVNFVKGNGFTKTIYYEMGKRMPNEKCITKNQIISLIIQTPNLCTVSYSIEIDETKKPLMTDDIVVRIKNRFSSENVIADKLWRIDLTMTTQLNGMHGVQSAIDSAFKNLPPANYSLIFDKIKAANEDINYEIEAEYLGDISTIKQEDIMAAITFVNSNIDDNYIRNMPLQNELQKVASLLKIENNGLKKMLPQVISITKFDYNKIFPPIGYYITDKADGIRALAYVSGSYSCIIADTIYNTFSSKITCKTTVLDGELIVKNEHEVMFFAFDVLYNNGEDLTRMPFITRLTFLDSATDIVKNMGIPARRKQYFPITSMDTIEKDFKAAKSFVNKEYTTDGLIIVEPDKSYLDTTSYKWKPNENNTIDFLAKVAPDGYYEKVDGKILYLLFVGASLEMIRKFNITPCPGYKELFGDINSGYIPIQFSPSSTRNAYMFYYSDDSLNNKIVEMRCVNGCKAAMGCGDAVDWDLVRIRNDRESDMLAGRFFGNDFRIAELTWENYIDPLEFDQLYVSPSQVYFNTEKSSIYNSQVTAISFMKTKRINTIQHAEWVIDMAAGKGQDLKRYMDANVENLIAIDNDQSAIAELVRRRYEISKKMDSKISVSVMKMDLNEDYKNIAPRIRKIGLPEEGANVVMCNLAFHYFAASVEKIRNMINLFKTVLQPGGIVILTVVIGEKIFDILKDIPFEGTWDKMEGDVKKYSIKKLYKESVLIDAGQKIGVLLPFSKGEYYEEPLLNTNTVIREFKMGGFELTARTNASDYLSEYKLTDRGKNLTADDETYISFYGELCFELLVNTLANSPAV